MTIAVFTTGCARADFGIVTRPPEPGSSALTGWRPAQPLNGQRCLTRAAFAAALPLARGWGVETGMTIDLLRQGLRITEVEVPLRTGPPATTGGLSCTGCTSCATWPARWRSVRRPLAAWPGRIRRTPTVVRPARMRS